MARLTIFITDCVNFRFKWFEMDMFIGNEKAGQDLNYNKDKCDGGSDIRFFVYCRDHFNEMADAMKPQSPAKNI